MASASTVDWIRCEIGKTYTNGMMTRTDTNVRRAKIPKVIMHNSVSLDGSVKDFEVNMGLHYQIAGKYKADVHLIGSNTIKTGIEMYNGEIPLENESDFMKPSKDTKLPYWVIPDTKGVAKGLLHVCRRFEFCRDVIVLTSERTSEDYVQYLNERNYDYFISGDKHVDYEKAFVTLSVKYGAKTILTDAGPTLNGILLEKGLVDEISLVVSPILVGRKSSNLFSCLDLKNSNMELELVRYDIVDKNYLLLRYKVLSGKV